MPRWRSCRRVTRGPDIPAMQEQLTVLVSMGKAKEAIGVALMHEQVRPLTDKDVEKYSKRYETYVGSKTTESLVDSFTFLASKAVGMAVNINDIEACQKALKRTTSSTRSSPPLQGRSL